MVMVLIGHEWFDVVESFDPETGENYTVKNSRGIVDVPVHILLSTWEELVVKLDKNVKKLYACKEEYLVKEREIIEITDFKELYGANNQNVRDAHVKKELVGLVKNIKDLEFEIEFIKSYIPLLKEVIKTKRSIQDESDSCC